MKVVRNGIAAFCILAALTGTLFGAGKKDIPLSDAEGLRNWERSFDVAGKKPGVYNLVVEGRDRAGNVAVAGPINVRVDPKTDIPVAVIANPISGMRIAGDLNVVGTCVDDDGVSKVELSVDGGEWFAAEGTAFWSALLKGADVPDGRRRVSARGVDSNGLVGPAHTVFFDMDKRRPVETVAAPAAGALLSGRVSFRGSVFDANGVASVEYSIDGGKTFLAAKGAYDKKAGIRAFAAELDTRKLPDGPSVVWLRSKDGVGSAAAAPVLLLVDNTKPTVELVSPAAEEAVDGDFVLIGYARDEVGLKSLSWKIGDKGQEIPVNPGDPFWVAPVKLSGAKGKETTVSIVAVDTSGNRTELKRRILLDAEADKPRATLIAPAAAERTEGSAFLAGYARDDDGVAAVEYWVDSKPPQRLETTGAFGVRVDGLAPGKRVLSVRAVDVNGVVGATVSAQVEDIGPPPSVEIAEIVYDPNGKEARTAPFESGAELAPDSKAAFRLRVRGGAVEWKLAGPGGEGGVGGSVPPKAADGSALIPLPASGPFGLLELSARVSDAWGRSASASGLVRVTDHSAVRGEPGFVFVDERLDAEGVVRFGATEHGRRPLRGRFVGAPLASARLEPESPAYEVSFDGQYVSVAPKGDGKDGAFVLTAETDRGRLFRSREYRFVSDLSGPRVSIEAPPSVFVGAKVVVSGTAEDGQGVASCVYDVGSGPVPVQVDPRTGRFETTLDLSAVGEGPVRLAVKAKDPSGNEGGATLDLIKDTEAPVLEFLPLAEGLAAGYARDPSGVASLAFAADGVSFAPLEDREAFVVGFDPAARSAARLKAVDRAGNERLSGLPPHEAPAPAGAPGAVPAVALLHPAAGTAVSGPVVLAFRIGSPRPVAGVSWSLGPASGTVDPSRLVPLDAQSTPDRGGEFAYAAVVKGAAAKAGALQAKVVVNDAGGKSGAAAAALAADPGKGRPLAEVRFPAEGETVAADFSASVSASSSRGIASFRFALDQTAPVVAESLGVAAFPLNALASGTHTLSVTAIDAAGVESLPVKRSFRVSGAGPLIVPLAVAGKDSKQDFRPGLAVALDSSSRLEGSVRAPNGLVSLEAAVERRPALKAAFKKESGADYSFSLPLPADLPFDRISLSLKAVDQTGSAGEASTFWYRVSPKPDSGVFGAPGLYASDPRVSADSGAAVRFSDARPLRLSLVGRPAASAALNPASDLLSVEAAGSTVILTPKADGSLAGVSVVVKDADGEEFVWGPRRFELSLSDPAFEVEAPAPDSWHRDAVAFRAKLSAPFGTPELSYSVDGAAWLPIQAQADPAAAGVLTASLPLEGADGARALRFRASDAAGRSVVVERVVNRDTAAPSGVLVVPREADAVNGRMTHAARFSDAGRLAGVEYSADGASWEKAARLDFDSRLVDYSPKADGAAPTPRFRVVDTAGNAATLEPVFAPDPEADKPRAIVQLPAEDEVFRSDFSVSGAAFDDDGIAAVHYSFDGGERTRLEVKGNGFSIPVDFDAATDNEHVVDVYAEDIYGVVGESAVRKFRISKEEPKATIAEPRMDTTAKGIVEIRGGATDANGVSAVELSFDNASTFNRTVVSPSSDGVSAEWSYRLDTRILKDGLHSLYVRPKDGYGTEGFFSSLVSVDNTPPALSLDLPLDGTVSDGALALSGRVDDARGLRALTARVFPLGAAGSGERSFELALDAVAAHALDLAGLPDGAYGLSLTAVDKAGNETTVTRDFVLKAGVRERYVALSSPVSGERLAGPLRAMGRVVSPERVSTASVFVDGGDYAPAPIDRNGWFSVDLGAAADRPPLAAGPHTVEVRFADAAGGIVSSGPVEVDYSPAGPWVAADSFAAGAYVPYRPFLSGTAGWTLAAEPADGAPEAKEPASEKRGREVASVEVSVDNGRTFSPASGRAKWKFRLETQSFPEGPLPLLIRARFRNGGTALSKCFLNLDKTPPSVRLLSPAEGGRFNDRIHVSGVASDDVELVSVALALRDGDKAGYKLPSFIQGLYLDAHAFGEPAFELGAGFTFFDDNVKLQFAYGQTPETFLGQDRGRFHGNVMSAKLLANLFTFPFGFWLGPDWNFLSANFALGANFSYFSETQAAAAGEEGGMVIGSVLGQIEFPKMKFDAWSMFRSYSFYVEGQLWFVSAEFDGGVKPAIALGLRMGIF